MFFIFLLLVLHKIILFKKQFIMKKRKTRVFLGITIKPHLKEKLRIYADEKNISISRLLENYIIEIVGKDE